MPRESITFVMTWIFFVLFSFHPLLNLLGTGLEMYILTSKISPLLNVTPSLSSWNPREHMILNWDLSCCCRHISLPYITSLDIRVILLTTRSHTSRCRHCNYYRHYNVDFVLFHNVTYYTNYLSFYHTSMLTIITSLLSCALLLPPTWY